MSSRRRLVRSLSARFPPRLFWCDSFQGRSRKMTIRSMQARVLVAAVAMLGVSASVTAGFRHTNRTVIVNQTTRYAEGQLGGARASSDGTQYIGCNTWARDDLPGQDGGASRHRVCRLSYATDVCATCVNSEHGL